jgi:hypothetical protein
MDDSLVEVLDLLPAQLLRLCGAHGLMIDCEAGTLWVTQEGAAGDAFLFAGQSQSMLPRGVILVEPVNGMPARLSLRRRQVGEGANPIQTIRAALPALARRTWLLMNQPWNPGVRQDIRRLAAKRSR